MSELHLSKAEEQVHQYFSHQATKALANETLKTYRIVLQTHLMRFCNQHGITELNNQEFLFHIDDYIDYFRISGCTGQTIQSYLTVTKLLFRFLGMPLVYTYRVPRNDRRAYDLKHEKRWFRDRHIALCRTYRFPTNHTRNHILVRLLIETGAREDEIAHIKIGDVNIRGKRLLLPYSKTIPRTVFFSEETAIHLENLFREKYPDQVSCALMPLFPGKSQIYKIITAMLADLGLKSSGDGRGPHTFRHYFATDLYFVQHVPLVEIGFMMGDTPDTVSKNYLHPTPEMLQNSVRKVSGM